MTHSRPDIEAMAERLEDGDFPGRKREEGFITSFNDHCVFVRYGRGSTSAATDRADLEWALTSPRDGEAKP